MINKKLFKKTLAGTMLAIIACTSMNATANPHWKWVGYLGAYNNPYLTGTVDEHCEGAVKGYADFRRDPNIAYTGTHYLHANSTIQCGMRGYPGAESTGFSPTCGEVPGSFWPGSYYDQENYDKGCFVDCDPNKYPNGGMPEACTTPVPEPEPDPCDPSNMTRGASSADCPKPEPDPDTCDLSKHPEGLPNSCAKPGEEFPPNPSLCDDPKTDRIKKDGEPIDSGGVACDKTGRYTCFWPTERFNNIYTNRIARQIARTCILEHEETHRKSNLNVCKSGQRTGSKPDKDGINRNKFKGEKIGYETQLDCLEKKVSLCGHDNDCVQELIDVMNELEKMIKYLDQSLVEAGSAPL